MTAKRKAGKLHYIYLWSARLSGFLFLCFSVSATGSLALYAFSFLRKNAIKCVLTLMNFY